MFNEINALKEIIINAAKDELLTRFAKVSRQQKADGSFVTEADLSMQARVSAELAAKWPDIAMLAEEMTTEQQQQALLSDTPLWCLDPLDGTSNFAAGIPYFAVSLSLIHRGQIQLGLVYDPVRDECFLSQQDSEASLNDQTLRLEDAVLDLQQATAIVDFKRLKDELAVRLVRETPFASQRNFGASALDWCWMAASRGHVYLHGKQNIWDYSAGYLVFQNAGGYASTLENEPLFNNTLQPRSVIAATDQSLFNQWKNWIQS